MESKHRDILQRRLPDIRRDLRVKYVIPQLIERCILLPPMGMDIYSKETQGERVDELICLLKTRGRKAFPVFCEILQETYPHLADLLQEEGDATTIPSTSTSRSQSRTLPACSAMQTSTRKGPILFIIHAGEDKKPFVRPLHKALRGQNLSDEEIFFDEVSISTGENISEKIMSTLASEILKLVTIVISNHLLDKYWPRLEYEKSLFHQKKFYPIWLDQNTDNFEAFSRKVGSRFPLLKKTLAHRIQYDNIAEEITDVAVKIVQLLSDQGYPDNVTQEMSTPPQQRSAQKGRQLMAKLDVGKHQAAEQAAESDSVAIQVRYLSEKRESLQDQPQKNNEQRGNEWKERQESVENIEEEERFAIIESRILRLENRMALVEDTKKSADDESMDANSNPWNNSIAASTVGTDIKSDHIQTGDEQGKALLSQILPDIYPGDKDDREKDDEHKDGDESDTTGSADSEDDTAVVSIFADAPTSIGLDALPEEPGFEEVAEKQKEEDAADVLPGTDGTDTTSEPIPATDEQGKALLEAFAPLLKETVIPGNIVVHLMSYFDNGLGFVRTIIADERNKGPAEAMQTLLVKLQTCEQPGWFQAFLNSLENSGYNFIKTIMEGRETIQDMTPLKRLLQLWAPQLQVVVAMEMLPHLPCLSDQDKDQIEAETRSHGNTRALITLIDRVTRFPPGWYRQFLQGLRRTKHDDLADELAMDRVHMNVVNKYEPLLCETIVSETPITIGLDASNREQPSATAGFDEFAEKQDDEGCEKMTPLQAAKLPFEQSELKDIPMRGYQVELAEPALEGRNTIICAPTGSGKTRVAIKITRDHLEGGTSFEVGAGVDARRRVVFLVNKVPLVEQQCNAFREYLSPKYDILPLSGETAADIPVGQTLPEHDVIILTAQVLENALRDELITLDTFSMLIFDECHHCQKNDPYNAIMTRYIKQKVEMKSIIMLPQIIGLTASLGVGKAKSLKDAIEHILGACANLDAEWIAQVVEHKEELQKYNQKPDEEVKPVSGRSQDPFAERVNMIMEDIENTLAIEASENLTTAELKPPRQREKQAYEQWVVTLNRKGALLEDKKVSRAIHAATTHLRKYFDALAINADARTKDALQYLERFVTGLQKEGFDGTDVDLVKHFTEAKERLQECAADPKYSNPKLDQLKYMILQAYEEKPDSRCLLFCKTRALTIALLTWMQEDQALRKLNPGRLVGAGASESTGGMTQNQQVELLELFTTGGHKIVISTSVAEEGIDIAKCNFVFRYDYVGNEIGKVQTRGRGRAEGSKSVLIAGREGGNVLKEKLNTIREKLMEKAMLQVWHMQREKHEDFMKQVRRLQEESKKDRDLAQALKEMQKKTKKIRGKGMKLLCVKCKEFACNVSDFRQIKENHHVVVDKTFPQRIKIKPHPPKKIDDWEMNGKVYCINCRQDWGIQMVYRQASFPTLKIESFVIEKSDGQRLTCRKWKNAPFYVKDITPDDISGMLEAPEEDEEDEPMFD